MKIFPSCFLVLFSVSFYAQTIRLEGIVKDTTSTPLEMANVMAVNQTTKAVDAYSITNDKGRFLLNLKPNANYNVRFSYLGLKTKTISVTTEEKDIVKNISLISDASQLSEIEVVKQMPVSVKGDTLIYNADSFKTGTERKLEDVLKKLPGVEVNANGEVEVEGKKVSKLMVEGKDFFDGDTKLGVKNIPADAIDKVQVLRNYNEIGALKGVENNEENVAMNIKLKSGKKNFWFGDVAAGAGVAHTDERYLVNPKLFYYSPKYSLNFIGNLNNIGELPLTIQDYFKFTGGFRSMARRSGTNFSVTSNDLGISLLRNNRAKEIVSEFGAANFSFNPNKKLSFSGFAILSGTETELETKNKTSFLDENKQIKTTENREELSKQNNNLGLFKLSTSYKPNEKWQLEYDVLTKTSQQNEDNSALQQTFDGANTFLNSQTILTNKKQDPITVNQNWSTYFTKSEKNIFALEMQHLYQNEDPFYKANLDFVPFEFTGYDLLQDRDVINQQRFVRTNKLDGKLDYYYVLTPKSNLNFTFGATNSSQNFDSYIFQTLDNASQNVITDADFNNDVKYVFTDLYFGFHYKILAGKFTLTPGFTAHKYTTYNDQLNTKVTDNFYRMLPDFFALYQIKKSETLSYNYAITNEFTDINKFAQGAVFSNYNSLYKGNRNLENALSHTHSLRYFKYNMFNFENIFGNINYSKRLDAVKSSVIANQVNQFSTAINSNFADESLNGVAGYGRGFARYYKASLNANINWSKFNNLRGIQNQTTESFSQTYSVKAATNYKELPNLEFGFSKVLNKYNGGTFSTDRPSVKLDYYFLNAFSFVAEYEYNNYYNSDKTVQNEYDFLSASVIYQKKGGKMEYKVSGTNLLNTTSLNDDSFNQTFVRTSQYAVQPRYVIFSVKYNI
ncbi:TonB-dependent receptor [Flavobacterium amnicola]|uniref:TonB-dependent receptor n=1 Tax=Flavobacterium amnicola TaxID=2506422 RepID=A0A4Q1K6V1_9FLAO|nr:TonB-dependent receptor [Flavobacterium amnicola]RXR21332.1 TonB-dependent receptor [Flavobacterium amnicola]